MSLSLHQKMKLMVPIPILFASPEQKAAVKLRKILRSKPKDFGGESQKIIDQYLEKHGNNTNTVEKLAIIAIKLKSTDFNDVLKTKFAASVYNQGLEQAGNHYKSKMQFQKFYAATAVFAVAASLLVGFLLPFALFLTLPLAVGGILPTCGPPKINCYSTIRR